MAETKVYTCDVCKEKKNKDDLANLRVDVDGIQIRGMCRPLKIDVCPDCLESKGFIVKAKGEKEEEQNRVTLKEKIFDFLHDIGL